MITFDGIWEKYKVLSKISTPTREDLLNILYENQITDITITEKPLGNMNSFSVFYLECSLGKGIFPKENKLSESFSKKNNSVKNIFDKWINIEWFIPAYITNGAVSACMSQVYSRITLDDEALFNKFDEQVVSLYKITDMCVFIEQVVPASKVLKSHQKTLREAILSLYSGYPSAATSSLIPIVENAINTFCSANGCPHRKNRKKIEFLECLVVSKYFNNEVWIPSDYKSIELLSVIDSRVLVIKSFFDWLLKCFFSDIDDYKGFSGLNRHIFSHGSSNEWQRPNNFHRLIGVLNNIVFLEGFIGHNDMMFLYPEIDAQSLSLIEEINVRARLQYFMKFRSANSVIGKNVKMPATTNDSGWLYRSSLLMETVMAGLVERLRDNRWQCKINEPVEYGEFVIVEAKKNDRKMNIAVLFTCATENEVYRELSSTCQYILYLGQPYKQDSFARGVACHVGPLQAWLTPD